MVNELSKSNQYEIFSSLLPETIKKCHILHERGAIFFLSPCKIIFLREFYQSYFKGAAYSFLVTKFLFDSGISFYFSLTRQLVHDFPPTSFYCALHTRRTK